MIETIKSAANFVLTLIIFSNIIGQGNVSAICEHPGEPIDGETIPDKHKYSKGEEITFRCSQSYVLIGEERTMCLGNNSWSTPIPLCGWNVGLRKQTEIVEETSGTELKEISLATDGNKGTCVIINRNLTLISYFKKRVTLSHVNVFVNVKSTDSLNISVKIFNDTSLTTAFSKHCHQEQIISYITVSKYNFICDASYYPQSSGAIQVTFSSTVAVKLCEITAISVNDRRCPFPEVCCNFKITSLTNEFVQYEPITIDCSLSKASKIRYCQHSRWSRKAPNCKVCGIHGTPCCKPEIPANGTISPEYDYYYTEQTVNIKCDEGYLLDGPSAKYCSAGSWSRYESYCDKNLMLNLVFQIPTQTEKKCLQRFTDGDISSSSILILNYSKTLLINLMGTYDINLFILSMDLNNTNIGSHKKHYVEIYIEINTEAEDTFRFCKKISYNEDDWTNNSIKFTCQGESTLGNIVRLIFTGNANHITSIELRELQILTTYSRENSLKRSCKIKQTSPNCVTREIFNSTGNQYLEYSPSENYTLYGKRVIRCSESSWEIKPPCCIFHNSSNCSIEEIFDSIGNVLLHYSPKSGYGITGKTVQPCEMVHQNKDIPICFLIQNNTDNKSLVQTLKHNETYKIWAFVFTSLFFVFVIVAICLAATKRIQWRNDLRKDLSGRQEILSQSKVVSFEEINNDIYDTSSLESLHPPSTVL